MNKQMLVEIQRIDKNVAVLLEAFLSNKRAYNLDEAAEYIGVSKSHMYKLTSQGKLRFSKPGGKKCWFSKEDMDNYLLSNPRMTAEEIDTAAATYITTHK